MPSFYRQAFFFQLIKLTTLTNPEESVFRPTGKGGATCSLILKGGQAISILGFLGYIIVWSIDFLGVPWSSLEFLGVPRSFSEFLGVPRSSSEFLGVPRSSSEFLGVSRSSSEFCGSRVMFC